MRRIYLSIVSFILILCGGVQAMQEQNEPYKVVLPDGNFVWEKVVKKVIETSDDDHTIKKNITRTYRYDPSTNRWKLQTEVRILSRSNSCQEITKKYEEKPNKVEVQVSKLTHSGKIVIPQGVATESITLGDYEAWDLND